MRAEMYATETRIEPSSSLGEHFERSEIGAPTETSSSDSVIEREEE